MSTSIQWTDETWNPVRGCARVSPGCENCYAESQAHRFSGKGQPYEGLTVLGKQGVRWAGRARFVPEMLGKPLKWKQPRKVFVNSMSDLFHVDVTNEQIAAVFAVMAACPQHTFQVLTKRPERMFEWFTWLRDDCGGSPNTADEWAAMGQTELGDGSDESETAAFWHLRGRLAGVDNKVAWPLPNVWIGVSCEDQKRADERIPLLLKVPATVHFVSAEPLLGAIELDVDWLQPRCKACGRHSQRGKCCEYEPDCTGGTVHSRQEQTALLDWIIVGGESGNAARPCNSEHIRAIVEQCSEAGVACFVKQLGRFAYADKGGRDFPTDLDVSDRKGGEMSEWPEDLRVREMPHTEAR